MNKTKRKLISVSFFRAYLSLKDFAISITTTGIKEKQVNQKNSQKKMNKNVHLFYVTFSRGIMYKNALFLKGVKFES